ncbi:MAG: FAD-binding protein [Actinomycetota bacterium]|nr:FAD-binding protein [Actinomycetota bacterium]
MIHPDSKAGVMEALGAASARGTRVLIVGGRQHMDRGNPAEVDAELWTTQLDGVVAYEPAEMIAVVEAGIRIGTLAELLSRNGQEWPVDAPPDATVGGVIAAGVSSARRLRVGHVRDTVVELELVTGDGRLVRSGARTVKNVTGYDIHRLATGSLGTLGVIVQAALKVRPLPQATRSAVVRGNGLALGKMLLRDVPMAAGVVATTGAAEVRFEGWDEEVAEMARLGAEAAGGLTELPAGATFPSSPPWLDGDAVIVIEAAVPASRIDRLVEGLDGWTALLGVGLAWFGIEAGADVDGAIAEIRGRAAALDGIAPVIRGPGGLGPSPVAGVEIHRRLKAAFDPAGVLAPGRFWHEAVPASN